MNGDKEELEWWSWIPSGWWRSQSGDGPNFCADGQNLKTDGQNLKVDGQNFTVDGDEDPWREVYGAWRRQVYRGLTSCEGI